MGSVVIIAVGAKEDESKGWILFWFAIMMIMIGWIIRLRAKERKK
jgi:hypothetical protein